MAEYPSFDEQLAALEKSLGLREGFIEGLRAEDDWSFVIKAHALLEAGVSQLLTHEIGKPGLADIFARLDMASGFGKLAIGEALGVIDKPTRRFSRALGEIRNDFVHNISNADCSLSDYLSRLDKKQLTSKHQALDLIWSTEESIEIQGKRVAILDLFRMSPKDLVAPSLGIMLVGIHFRTTTARVGQDMRRHADELFRNIFLAQRGAAQASPDVPRIDPLPPSTDEPK